jgi:hypothetical protein
VKRKTPEKRRAGFRISADVRKQLPNNSYSPKLFYEDASFTCRDCGVKSVWTAEQQRLWYEEWKGPIQSIAIRCRACRQRLRQTKTEQKQHMREMEQKVHKAPASMKSRRVTGHD